MILKLSTWLVVALAGGALVAGCGSSASKSSSQTTSPATRPITPAEAQHAAATCKHGVQAQPTISASAKPKLEKICEKVGTGDTTALQQVAKEVCLELVNASHVPAGAAKQRALAICKVR